MIEAQQRAGAQRGKAAARLAAEESCRRCRVLPAMFRSVDLELDDLRLRKADAGHLLAELLLQEAIEVSPRPPYVSHAASLRCRSCHVRDLAVAERLADPAADLVVLLKRGS